MKVIKQSRKTATMTKFKIQYDAPASSPNTRAWVIGTADTNRSEKWLDCQVRLILQMGAYEKESSWQDSLFSKFEGGQPLKMPISFVRKAYKNIQEAKEKLIQVTLESGQKRVWPARSEEFTSMSLAQLQNYCDEWLTTTIRKNYDMQILGAAFLQNKNRTCGEYGPNEIHPNAKGVKNTLEIADVRMSCHPWGRGHASQW